MTCASSKTTITPTRVLLWLIALALPACWVLIPGVSPLVVECLIALSLFGVIKSHVLHRYVQAGRLPSLAETLAWLAVWPGLDAEAFFRTTSDGPTLRDWIAAILKTAVGLVGGFAALQLAADCNDFLRGWIVLLSLVMTLHFGLFHIAALIWKHCGRDVTPIMNAPLLATSVNDFWTYRWNLAFRDYATRFVFRPLARATSPKTAIFGGYVFSGVIHELAISVPAAGGYGLPTLYFLIQGLAILTERKLKKAGCDLTIGFQGRMWTALVVAPGALMLFHPQFVVNVAAPLADLVQHTFLP